MAEESRFFDAVLVEEIPDRQYPAEDFAEYFRQFLTSGVYHQDEQPGLKVRATGQDMQTYVEAGYAFIDGYLYKNTENLYLTHAAADPAYNRIDRVVIRLDKGVETRAVYAAILTGVPNSSPQPPEVTRTGDIYEISLAQVLITAASGIITEAKITDERLNQSVCGLVSSLITIPSSEFQNQFQQLINNLQAAWDTWFNEIESGTYITYFDFHVKTRWGAL